MPNVKYPDTLVVSVTQERIDAGIPGDCRRCPGALAALAAVPGAHSVRVDDDMIEFREPSTPFPNDLTVSAMRYAVPPELLAFIDLFDNEDTRAQVKPFTCTAERYEWPKLEDEED